MTGDPLAYDRQVPPTPDMPDMAGKVADLEADVRRLQAARGQVTGERDYLRPALAARLSTAVKLPPAQAGQRPW
ncbi:MAG: hypothetical protein ACYCYF_06135 [Anaerolineae bacterium]